MKKTIEYSPFEIEVTYLLRLLKNQSGYDWSKDDVICDIAKKFKGGDGGSGAGCGERDLILCFDVRKNAQGFIKRVRKIKGVKVTVTETVIDEDEPSITKTYYNNNPRMQAKRIHLFLKSKDPR